MYAADCRLSLSKSRQDFQNGIQYDPSELQNLATISEAAFRKIGAAGKKMFEETRTPLESLKAQLETVNQVMTAGGVDAETAARKVKQLEAAFNASGLPC
ncbi:Uncharacterised protein [Bergeriella denitrificans]|uniref:Uncharacterized protein n=2 Tax=Bergeriella denitrificans TaxID=494 RepID=A0A378UTD6_BERDE|nr:Uncharacterised protein [Bergeriella denitrificans]